MANSTNLLLPYLAGGQAQKHVTVNEGLRKLDGIVQLAVESATVSAQPGGPSDGQRYILPAGKTGAAWGAMTNLAIAYYRDGEWEQLTPREGWVARVKDTDEMWVYTGSAWITFHTDNARKLLFTPGGDGAVSFYRIDATHAQNPRTATISSVAGDVITLTTSIANTFFLQSMMQNVSYVRIWNTTKNPDESAWVKAQPAANQLTVRTAADIATWANGDTIQLGDELGVTPGRVIAIDISQMLQNTLGRVFRQSGMLVKMSCATIIATSGEVTVSENGASGTFTGLKNNSFDGLAQPGQVTTPCSVLSPISDSNLIFLRETVTGANMGVSLVSCVGVYV